MSSVPKVNFKPSSMTDILDLRSRNQPSGTAYIWLEGESLSETTLTYSELSRAARTIASYLESKYKKGERALLIYPPGLNFAISFFACLYAGIVPVPVYPPRQQKQLSRIFPIIADSKPSLVLTESSLCEKLVLWLNQFVQGNGLEVIDTSKIENNQSFGSNLQGVSSSDLAFLQYTSGSTGNPKGVMVSHGNLLHNSSLIKHNFQNTEDSVIVIWLPPYHDMGLIGGLLQPIYSGSPIVLMSPLEFLRKPLNWLTTISKYKATTSGGPNFAFDLCVERIDDTGVLNLDLSSWNVAFTGAEPIRRKTLDNFYNKFSKYRFDKKSFFPCYGLAEATLFVTGGSQENNTASHAHLPDALEEEKLVEDSRFPVSCGRIQNDLDIEIVNPETLLRLKKGSVGEIWISGPSVAQGYWNNLSLTQYTFQNSISPNEEKLFLRTGDLGFLKEDELFVTGRIKELIIVRGRNYYPQDLEATAQTAHPALHGSICAALSVEDSDNVSLVCEVSRHHRTIDFEEVANLIRAQILTNYDLAITSIFFVNAGSIPRTTSGKIKRLECQTILLNDELSYLWKSGKAEPTTPLNSQSNIKDDESGNQPTSFDEIESYIIQEVKKLIDDFNTQGVSSRDSLINLGIDSVRAARLINAIDYKFSISIGFEAILNELTIGELSFEIYKGLQNSSATAPALQRKSVVALERTGKDNDALAMSWAQQRLWFIDQLDANASAAYHIPFAVRLTGVLDTSALERSFTTLTERHEVLRTVFRQVDGQAIQVIQEAGNFALDSIDLSDAIDLSDMASDSPDSSDARNLQEAKLRDLVIAESSRAFDLSKGPLLRATLVKLSDEEQVLAITMHHIISDGWSMEIFFQELSTLYLAYTNKQANPLPPLEIQYADYAVWQREVLAKETLEQQLSYWRTHLADTPALLELPLDHPRPPVQSYQGASAELSLSPELSLKLKDLSKQQGSTLFMTLMAAWSSFLGKLSNQDDVVIGTPTANRQRAEVEGLIGFFVNTLAIRTDLSDNPTFTDLLEQVKANTLTAFDHQDVPFEQVIEVLQPERSLSHSPLFQVMFAWQNMTRHMDASVAKAELGAGIKMTALEFEHTTAQFDLTLSLAEEDGVISGAIEYATDLFTASTIERFMGYFKTFLEQVVNSPQAPIGHLSFLPAAQRQQVLYDFNDTKAEYPKDKLIHQLFEEQVARSPEAVAVVFEDTSLTYQELNNKANQLAHYLIAEGIQPDDLVGICVERSLEMIIGLLGILKAGGAYVPLDPSYPKERLSYMLQDAQPKVLLTQAHLDLDLPSTAADTTNTNSETSPQPQHVFLDDWQLLEAHPTSNPDPIELNLNSLKLAYVIYTSGSTGQPKGVLVQHQGLLNYLQWSLKAYELRKGKGSLVTSSLSFDATVTGIYIPLLSGLPVCLLESGEEIGGLKSLFEQSTSWGLIKITPSYLNTLSFNYKRHSGTYDVDTFVIGGEELSPSTVARWNEINPGIRLVNEYGPTETVVGCSTYEIKQVEANASSIPIGRPISNTQIYILDPYMQPVPIGVAGEMYIGGDGVARGYLNQPELTAERFLSNPFVEDPEARMYKTGDLGRWLPDGNIEFLGRNDDQVKIRGFRIELGEIEAKLLEHQSISEAVVIARQTDTEDSTGGTGDKRLVAYCVPADLPADLDLAESSEAVLDIEALKQHLKQTLPEYMIPSAYVSLTQLPLTPNGKLDKRALPAPDISALQTRKYEAPVGEVEETLAQIWQDLLDVERVGRHDNFFDLGGHSLLLVQLIEQLRQVDLSVDLRSVFGTPVLMELATQLEKDKQDVFVAPPNLIPKDSSVIEPDMLSLIDLTQEQIDLVVEEVPGGAANVQDIYPLTPLQEGILFHHLLAEEGDPYVLQSMYAFDSRKLLDKLLEACQKVIDRHDVFRTAVLWEHLPRPMQVVCREAQLPVHEVQLSHEGDAVEALKTLTDPLYLSMDLTQAPLLEAHIAKDPNSSSGEWLLALRWHHLVGDHVTLDVIMQELQALLPGQDEPTANTALAPYRDFVAQTLAQAETNDDKAFFTQMLGDVEEPTAPFGMLDTYSDARDVEEFTQSVDARLALRLRTQAKALGVSPAVICHAAYALVVAKTSGRDDVVFGTVLSGRLQGTQGADRLMGMLINTLPLRIKLAETNILDLIQQTQHSLIDLLEHEQASLALAQRCSSVPNPAPLFTSLFNYRHSAGAGAEQDNGLSNIEQAFELTGLEGIRVLDGQEQTNYPLLLSVDDLGETGFSLTAQTQIQVKPERVTELMHTALDVLTQALAAKADTHILDISILGQAQRQQVLYDFNDTKAEYPKDKLIHQLFEEQVARSPEAVAVVFEDTSLTYQELNNKANQLAHYLIAEGIQPDDLVGICVERSLEMIIGLLGILKAGGAYVPLDPSYPKERLSYMLQDAQPKVLLTQTQLGLNLSLSTNSEILHQAVFLDDGQTFATQPTSNPDPTTLNLNSLNLAYVIYTSGSTGQPKGVLVQHTNVVRLFGATQEWFDFDKDDVWTLFHSFAFDFAVWELWGALLHGGRLVIVPSLTIQSPQDLYQLICREGVTVLNQTPSAFTQFIAAQQIVSTHQDDISHKLRSVIFGGEALEFEGLKPWIEQNSDQQPQLVNMYGITETTVHVTYQPLTKDLIYTKRSSLIGKPIPDLNVYILDPYMQPVPIGVAGEMYIGGDGVARGYLNQPELTAERFLSNPFVEDPEARMYKTGDLGRWLPDGNIEFLGRNDDQVKIRGFRIELGEIEAKLLEHQSISEAVVIARQTDTEDSTGGTGDKRLVAYCVPHALEDEEDLDIEALKQHLKQTLPEYMIPSAYVSLTQLPLTPNGKLDKRALPAPDISALQTRKYEAPVGEVEETLAQIWQDLLDVERVGRHDNFFDLGGHSLLAVQLANSVQQQLKLELSLRDLFAYPILQDLSRTLASDEPAALPPIAALVREGSGNDALAMSWAQQRLWFIDQLDANASAAYHIPFAVRLTGVLDTSALERSFTTLTERHEVLRTVFRQVDGQAIQVIQEAGNFALDSIDLSDAIDLSDMASDSPDSSDARNLQEAKLRDLVIAESSRAFDLSKGPLLRATLVKLSDEEQVLAITMHHIISDGWSMEIFFQELSTLYLAYTNKQANPLPPLEIQYADYAVWQREVLAKETLEQQLSYWRTHLADTPALLELPLDHPRPPVQSYQGASAELSLSPELSLKLKDLSKQQGSTLFMTLMAAWSSFLGKLSNQDDVVIGTPTANRQRAEVEGLIGFFVNTLAIRTDLSDNPTFTDLLEQVKANTLTAFDHQDVPFEQVIEVLQPERSLSHSPLFQVMFAWQNMTRHMDASVAKAELGAGIKMTALEFEHTTAQFDLTLSLAEEDGVISGAIEYATDLFTASTIERFMGYFKTFLEQVVNSPQAPIGHLSFLPAAQRQQVLYDFNDTKAEYPKDKLIHQLFEEQVARSPEAVAVVFEDTSLTYQELNNKANQLAHYLIAEGIQPDDLVGICVERSLEMIIGLLGILKAGGAYVPLDPSYPKERLSYMLQDAQPKVLLTQAHLDLDLPSTAADTTNTNSETSPQPQHVFLDDWQLLEAHPTSNPDPIELNLNSLKLAYVIYTSGSTGQPKGVLVQHQGLCNLATTLEKRYSLTQADRVLQFATIAFDVAAAEVFGSLCSGSTLIVPKNILFTTKNFWDYCAKFKASSINLPTAFWHQLAHDKGAAVSIPSTIRSVTIGGEQVSAPAISAWFVSEGHSPPVINAYGPTEATVDAITYNIEDVENNGKIIGRPISNTQIYILDPYMQPVPIGVAGEMYIGGDGVARGYLNQPELTAERFLSNPFVEDPEARMYKTGDLGRWLPDGNIEFLGRNDDQVKIRGFRIELGEIEAKLLEHQSISEAVVIARQTDTEDSTGGTGDKRLVAYCVPHALEDEEDLDIEALKQHLKQTLPEYMIPSAYVSLTQLPLTPNGKLDKRALPAPDINALQVREYKAPEGAIEQALAQIWQDLLDVERVGRHDNFFDLGGHSLLLVQLIEQLRQVDLSVDLRSVFGTPVLMELATQLEKDKQDVFVAPPNLIPKDSSVIEPDMLSLIDLTQEQIDLVVEEVPGGAANVQDIYPLTPLQEGILFHHLLAEEGDPYVLQSMYAFDSRKLLDKLLEACQKVIDRHDVFRTAVLWEHLPRPMQVVCREAQLPVHEVQLSHEGDAVEALKTLTDPLYLSMDLTQAPLLEAHIAKDPNSSSGEWLLALRWHHLVGDHVTLDVIMQELQALLPGQDEPTANTALAPYRDFVAQTLAQAETNDDKAFFTQMLGDVEEPTAPFGMLDTYSDARDVEEFTQSVDARLALRLRTQAKALGVSPAVICHAAYALVVAKTSGRDDVVFGTVLSGRLQGTQGADRLMGMLINTLPLRIKLAETNILDLIQQTQHSLIDLLEHEQASLALAQRCSSVPNPAPLFTSLFNYRHSAGAGAEQSSEAIGLEGMRVLGDQERTNYPFVLSVDDLGKAGFSLTAEIKDQVEPERITELMHTALDVLLESLETDTDTSILEINILPAAQRQQVLYDFNDTKAEYPKDKLIHQLFEEQVARSPEAVAVVFEDTSLTYQELNNKANQLAHYLIAEGIQPDDLVGICVERSLEMIIGLLGILKAGGAYVPLDPSYPKERLSYMLQDAQPKVLLTQEKLGVNLLGANIANAVYSVIELDRDWKHVSKKAIASPVVDSKPQDPIYVIYTSGSTGQPKGVVNTHESLVNRILWMREEYQLDASDAILQKTPFSFDVSVWELFLPLVSGSRLALALPESHKDPEQLLVAINTYQITTLHFVPSMLNGFLQVADGMMPSLKRVICSGEALGLEIKEKFCDSIDAELHNLYGPTEAAIDVTYFNCSQTTTTSTIPIGRPISNTQIYILDPYMQPVPIGVAGEMYIGGDGVARGYLNQPELTAERFLSNPFVEDPEARMYKTGDLGRWLPDGNIEFLGRNDDQVKIRGFRIELGEIEAKLLEHQSISEAVVIARQTDTEDSTGGTGDKRLVAYCVPADLPADLDLAESSEAVLDIEALKQHLKQTLPEYMIPSAYVSLTQLPLTPNGKLDKRALPAPDINALQVREYKAPEGAIEQALAQIWQDLLQVERVGRHDNFFDLGGHSLLLVQLGNKIEKSFAVDLPLNNTFRNPTLMYMSENISIVLAVTEARDENIVDQSDWSEMKI